jgi:hypothetical protein
MNRGGYGVVVKETQNAWSDRMTARDLWQLLDDVDDTHELVLRGPGSGWYGDELFAAWAAARAEANSAYETWRTAPGGAGYAAYRASEDRADAAQEAFAEHMTRAACPPR